MSIPMYFEDDSNDAEALDLEGLRDEAAPSARTHKARGRGARARLTVFPRA